MRRRLLFFFVEGNDDERFVESVLLPHLYRHYKSIQIYQYARKKQKDVNALLRSLSNLNADFVWITDINGSPCVTQRKDKTISKYAGLVNAPERVAVVIKEIESWYLAGLDDEVSERMGLVPFRTTDDLTKEEFDRLIPQKFDSRIDFMVELLKKFESETAVQKNRSFEYFVGKFLRQSA